MPLSLPEFVERYKASTLSERSVAQSHFIDLCKVLRHPHPAEADHTGESFTFEKHVSTNDDGKGYADVWKRGFFGWEYKGKHHDLAAAYRQLLRYREDLENPPLLITCDQERFEVHTNFTGTKPQVWARAQGTQLREVESGFRYTPSTTFDTFPLPWPPSQEPHDSPLVRGISEAARDLVAKRDAWLNPPGATLEELKSRTLTNLYNARPTWLADLHRKLDAAVFAAYGWPSTLTDAEILERLLALNHARVGKAKEDANPA